MFVADAAEDEEWFWRDDDTADAAEPADSDLAKVACLRRLSTIRVTVNVVDEPMDDPASEIEQEDEGGALAADDEDPAVEEAVNAIEGSGEVRSAGASIAIAPPPLLLSVAAGTASSHREMPASNNMVSSDSFVFARARGRPSVHAGHAVPNDG